MNFRKSFPIFQRKSKCQEVLLSIFDPYLSFLEEELFKLSLKDKEKQEDTYIHEGIIINCRTFYNPVEKVHDYKIGYSFLHSSLIKEGAEFLSYVENMEKDAAFLNQWLSIAINANDPEITRKQLPNFIADLHPIYKDYPYKFCYIPKGKEPIWKKAEELSKYYLGFKILI